MIDMAPLDVSPPDETIRTPKVHRPEPDTDPLDIWEADRFLEVPNGSGEKDKGILFSGGNDSLALTHYLMEEKGWGDWVVHLSTNSEVPANLDFVREVCRKYQWPLIIIASPLDLETLGCRYGFAGPGAHDINFHALKGRQLGYLYRRTNGGIKFFSGVRTDESDRRKINVTSEVEYADPKKGDDFRGWWISPIMDRDDQWIQDYRDEHALPRNPVASSLHRSGDCQCLAFGHRDEELLMLEAEYPDMASHLRSIEQRVQEYRGRVKYLQKNYPRAATAMRHLRKRTRPNPFMLTLLREHRPSVYSEVTELSVDEAVTLGQMENENYLGHGGLSSKEMRSLIASKDSSQMTVCENCGEPADGVSCSVKRQIEEASSRGRDPNQTPKGVQKTTGKSVAPVEVAGTEQAELNVDLPTEGHTVFDQSGEPQAEGGSTAGTDQSEWGRWEDSN